MDFTISKYDSNYDNFQEICNFFLGHSQYFAERTPWSYQRLIDWKFGKYKNRLKIEAFWDRSLICFYLEDSIIGLAINEDGNDMITVLTSPDYRHLYADFLDVAIQELLHIGENILIELSERQDIEASVLLEKGYEKIGEFSMYIYDLKDTQRIYKLPKGYRILSMLELERYSDLAQLRSLAFTGELLSDKIQVEQSLDMMDELHKAPTYYGDTNLVVLNSEGEIVAGCEPLINFKGNDAEIERVCTLPSYRGQGLAKAVISEAMKRLKVMGIEKVYITGFTDETKHLYSSYGTSKREVMHTFSKSKR